MKYVPTCTVCSDPYWPLDHWVTLYTVKWNGQNLWSLCKNNSTYFNIQSFVSGKSSVYPPMLLSFLDSVFWSKTLWWMNKGLLAMIKLQTAAIPTQPWYNFQTEMHFCTKSSHQQWSDDRKWRLKAKVKRRKNYSKQTTLKWYVRIPITRIVKHTAYPLNSLHGGRVATFYVSQGIEAGYF